MTLSPGLGGKEVEALVCVHIWTSFSVYSVKVKRALTQNGRIKREERSSSKEESSASLKTEIH